MLQSWGGMGGMEVKGSELDYFWSPQNSLFLPGPSRTCTPSRTAGQGHILVPSGFLTLEFWVNRARKVRGHQQLKCTHWLLCPYY